MLDDIEVLGLLVTADEVAGDPQTYVLTYTGAEGRVFVGVVGWPDDVEVPSEHQVDDLGHHGWVRISQERGRTRTFAVTSGGRRAWATHVAQQPQPGRSSQPIRLDWASARQLLETLHETFLENGGDGLGVDTLPLTQDADGGRQTAALLNALIRDDYLDVTMETAAGPRVVRPSAKAVRLLEGWPAGPAEAALTELVRELDDEIDRTSDEGKRSKLVALRDGLVGVGRDIAVAFIEKQIGV
jgi:hypothetical protein